MSRDAVANCSGVEAAEYVEGFPASRSGVLFQEVS
jgi:hypothetical protein